MTKKFIASVTLAAFTSLAVPVYAVPHNESSMVVVEKSWGEVQAPSGNIGGGDSVAYGETIRTESKAGLTLLLPSGSRYRVSPESEFRIDANETAEASLHLVAGKVLASANGPVQVTTAQTDAVATKGEFVLSASAAGADLQVLSGDAKMTSSEEINFVNLPKSVDTILAYGQLRAHQRVAFTSEFDVNADGPDREQRGVNRTKNPPVNVEPQTRRTSPDEDELEKGLSPDQDILNPGEEPGAVVENPPPTQPTSTAPATTSAGAASGGSPWPWIIGGFAGLGALIALASNNEDDDAGFPNIDNINVPSPSLP